MKIYTITNPIKYLENETPVPDHLKRHLVDWASNTSYLPASKESSLLYQRYSTHIYKLFIFYTFAYEKVSYFATNNNPKLLLLCNIKNDFTGIRKEDTVNYSERDITMLHLPSGNTELVFNNGISLMMLIEFDLEWFCNRDIPKNIRKDIQLKQEMAHDKLMPLLLIRAGFEMLTLFKELLQIKISNDQTFTAIDNLVMNIINNFKQRVRTIEMINKMPAGELKKCILNTYHRVIDEPNRLEHQIVSLIDKACVSRKTFERQFKRVTGESFYQFIKRNCMEKARHQILYTNNTLDAIAEEVGYNRYVSFGKAFNEQFGVDPEYYRTL